MPPSRDTEQDFSVLIVPDIQAFRCPASVQVKDDVTIL